MTLRARLTLLLCFSLVIVAAVTMLTFRVLFLGTFEDLEEDQLTRIAVETRRMALEEVGAVTSASLETASLSGMKSFLETGNADLIWRLTESASWTDEGLDAFAVFDSSGSLLFASGIVPGGSTAPFPAGLLAKVGESGFSVPSQEGDCRGGILFAGTSAWFVGICEVMPTEGDGPPGGVVLMADRLDGAATGELNFMPGYSVEVLAPEAGPPGIDPDRPDELILRTGPDSVVIYATLGSGPGLDAVLKIEAPREIYGLGRKTADRVTLMVVLAGIVFVLVSILLFQGVVMTPLKSLSSRIEAIGESGDMSRRCGFAGDDELADLAATLDGTLDKLERASVDLRHSRLRFELFARFLPGYSFIQKSDGRLVYANEGFRRDLLGSREDWEGVNWEDLWPADQALLLARDQEESLRTRRPLISELDVPAGARGVRRLLFHTFPIGPDPDGTFLVGGIAIDVTERARTEERLLHSEMRNEAILSAIPESVLIISRDGTILDFRPGSSVNSEAVRSFLEGRRIGSIGLTAGDVARSAEIISRALRLRSVESIEISIPAGPAAGVYECRLAPFENDSVVCTFRNVTEKRRMEADLFNSQKQASLSLMAGGIAHDFKNILSAVTGNIDLCAASEHGGPEAAEYLSSALEACDKALLMLRQLEILSRGTGAAEMTRLDLGALLESTARLVTSGSGIELSVTPQKNLWTVLADEGRMVQAFSNFIVNAREAMSSGGRLDIRLWNGMTRDGDRQVLVSIGDTGPGMPPEVLARVFDPYFSTKSRGSGLGLAVTASIIKQHGGRIEVVSSPGSGTTFTVILPAG